MCDRISMVDNGSQEADFEASADGHSGTNPHNTTSSQEMPVNTMGSQEMADQSTGDSDSGTQLPRRKTVTPELNCQRNQVRSVNSLIGLMLCLNCLLKNRMNVTPQKWPWAEFTIPIKKSEHRGFQ